MNNTDGWSGGAKAIWYVKHVEENNSLEIAMHPKVSGQIKRATIIYLMPLSTQDFAKFLLKLQPLPDDQFLSLTPIGHTWSYSPAWWVSFLAINLSHESHFLAQGQDNIIQPYWRFEIHTSLMGVSCFGSY